MLLRPPIKKASEDLKSPLGSFKLSMKQAKKQDPLLLYALTFVGEGGIYRWAEALGFVPNHQQREAMDAYNEAMMGRGSPRIACRAGKGPGKTKVTAVIFTHW